LEYVKNMAVDTFANATLDRGRNRSDDFRW
jgi:hypothetical protein